jgi:hypothetical protein
MPRYPALEALSELPDTSTVISSFELTRVGKHAPSDQHLESDALEMSLRVLR